MDKETEAFRETLRKLNLTIRCQDWVATERLLDRVRGREKNLDAAIDAWLEAKYFMDILEHALLDAIRANVPADSDNET